MPKSANSMRASVLIVHGLWVSGGSMALLAYLLRRQGFDVETFSYHTVRDSLSDNAAGLRRRIEAQREPPHLVGHSLGGCLILQTLEEYPQLRVGRVVLMAPPYRNSYSAQRLATVKVGGKMIGRSMRQWFTQEKKTWSHAAELGVIAGTRSVGLGRVFRGLPRPNDGTITVEETRIPGMKQHLIMHASHSEMVVSPRIAAQVAHFLHQGAFAHAATEEAKA